jgi:hypothetical protein
MLLSTACSSWNMLKSRVPEMAFPAFWGRIAEIAILLILHFRHWHVLKLIILYQA